ncbi:LysR family transcriptional regulator [Aureimonas ureilytica]|uniref:LysR family transcriptional regulator n=1 Tax=Aureimonas ureilytica TaxID=401562 RepID=A0A175RDQ9_9HYPH|nr:LysR family transcriptional regulator [Aureimonas ureilytica]KTQ97297.1 LysR family transcriptional regulator [Aureimonas ureilytica]
MRFDLADLSLFLAIVEAGSITHGAARANLSLPAASERLRDMEAASGVLLLVRRQRGVEPTRAGDTLAYHARLVLRQVGAMQAELSDHARGFRGRVRVMANSAAIAGCLPARLGPFLALHPGADIELAERPSPDIVKALANGLCDLGIVSDAADTSALSTSPFAVDRLVLVTATNHRLARERRVAFADVAGEPMIGFDGALQGQIEEQGERLGYRIRPRIRLRSFESLCRMVADGAGVGIIPQFSAQRARRSMPLSCLRLTDAWATRKLLLCWRSQESLDPLNASLRRHLALVEARSRPHSATGNA